MNILDDLNDVQKEAVLHHKGPLLILAGAGSGKTRVLTRRIAYLIEAYGVSPWNILALTFTNKAAIEMRDRVDDILDQRADHIWVSTFHSACVKILRRFIDEIGYDKRFSIYDTDDTKTLMKGVLKSLNIDNKIYPEKAVLSIISKAKNRMKNAEDFAKELGEGSGRDPIARAFFLYEKKMRENNALDFDDLLLKTVELFEKSESCLSYYRRRFQYLLVDEYQDTNQVQFRLLQLLAHHENEEGEVEHNLCVVGDDDQSIYKFRGADIRNILNFEKEYPSTRVIKLEENYRSTGNILAAANGVIKNNSERKQKTLWTRKEGGAFLSHTRYSNGYREAEGIVKLIQKEREKGRKYSDIAVLYRMNAQSLLIEEKLILWGLPYKIVGGVNFYSRKEIKDILAYLKVFSNPDDDIQIRRILNVPKRGIGKASEEKVAAFAEEQGLSFYEAAKRASEIGSLKRAASKISDFINFIDEKRSLFFDEEASLLEAVRVLLEEIGYIDDLRLEGTEEAESRIENIEELMNKIVVFDEEDEDDGETDKLWRFLSEVSLVSDIDNSDMDADSVTLMTLHSAKGLEFPVVFIPGMEEGVFPSYRAMDCEDEGELEEERRLCYVGLTRAMEKLYLSSSIVRMFRGQEQMNRPSRFLKEIPIHLLKEEAENGPIIRERKKLFSEEKKEKKEMGLFNNPYISLGLPKTAETVELSPGDRVSHMKFGVGTVLSLSPDQANITVSFDNEGFGERTMKKAFAGLKKI